MQRDRITSLDLMAMLLLMQSRIWLAFCEGTLLAHVQLPGHEKKTSTTRSFLEGLCFPFISQLVLVMGVDLIQVQDLVFRFVEPHEVYLGLSRSLWMASHTSGVSTEPYSVLSSANLLRVHLTPLLMSLMKILRSIIPSTCKSLSCSFWHP